jgi:hypothetical protein
MTQFTAPRPQLLTLRKPRNPLVAPALMRQAGRHGGSAKAQRQQANLSLRKQVQQTDLDRGP